MPCQDVPHITFATEIFGSSVKLLLSQNAKKLTPETCVLLLLLKPAAHARERKTKLFINCFRHPIRTCATETWRKHNSRKQPTVDCTLEPIQPSSVKHSVGKAGNTKQIVTFYTLYFDPNGWAEDAARVRRTLIAADGSSLNRQWL